MTMQLYPCPFCAARFDTFQPLEAHLKTHHDDQPDIETYRCVTCDEEFWAAMRAHGKERGQEPPGD